MPDLAELGLVVRSDQAVRASRDLDKLAKSGEKAENSFTGLSRTSQDTESKLGKMTGTVKILAGALAGLAASFTITESIKEFAEFEKSLIGVGKTTNITGAELAALGDEIEKLTRVMPNSAVELNNIAQAAGQLGVTGSDNILKFTETVARLGSATNLSGEEAATTLARMLTVTGEAISSVDVLGSVIVRLGNNFAATEAEIAGAATRVAQATALYGTSAAEVSAIGTAMTAVGVQAEAGGTVVGRAFSVINAAVQKGGKELALLEEITGKTGAALKETFTNNSTQAFEEFIVGLGKIEKSQVAGVLEELGLTGTRVEAVLGTLAVQSGVLTDALSQARDEVENTSALMTESEVAATAFANQMQIVSNNADEMKVAIGRVFAPAVLVAAQKAGDAMLYVAENIDKVITAAEILAIAITSKLVVALAAKTATTIKDTAASIALAKATATQTEFALAAAQAEVRMAVAMEAGIARSNALAAASARVAAAHKAHAVALTNVSLAARASAASMSFLGKAMAFFGGPIGLAITAVAAGFLLFSKNADQAKASADALGGRIENLKNKYLSLNEAQLRGALIDLEKNTKALEDNVKMAEVRLETLAKQARFAKDLKKQNEDTTKARAALADAEQELAKAEEFEIKVKQQLIAVEKGLTTETDKATEATTKLTTATSEVCKAAKETGTCAERFMKALEKENKELSRLAAAQSKGIKAYKETEQAIAAENAVLEKGIDLKSEEGQQLLEAIKVNDQYRDSIEANTEAQADAQKAEEERIKAAKAANEENARILQQPFLNAIDGIQNASTKMFKDILDGGINSFDDLSDAVVDIFKQMLAEMATLAIARPIIVPVVQSIGGFLGVPGMAGASGLGVAGGGAGGSGSLSSLGSLYNFGSNVYGYSSAANAAGIGTLASLGAGFSQGFGLASANIAAAGYGGAFGANAQLAASSFQSGAYGTAFGAASPYIPIVGGAIYGYTQGGVGGAATGAGGAYAGATIGSYFGPIGTVVGGAIGAILGGLLGGKLFGGNEPNIKFGSKTGGTTGTPGPFGKVDVYGKDFADKQIEKAFVTIDKKFAEYLNESEISSVSEELAAGKFAAKFGSKFHEGEQFKIFEDRVRTIFKGLDLGETYKELTENIKKNKKGIEEMISVTGEFLAQRDSVRKAIEEWGEIVEPMSAVASALERINAEAESLVDAAEELKLGDDVIDSIAAKKKLITDDLRKSFDEAISVALYGLTDPVKTAFDELEKVAEQRVKYAELLGANLANVEQLNAIERENLLTAIIGNAVNAVGTVSEDFADVFDNIKDYLKSFNLSAVSPLTPEQRLAESQHVFDLAVAAAKGGDLGAISDLPNLANQLIGEGASFYAGTSEFQGIFSDVRNTLDELTKSQITPEEQANPIVQALESLGIQGVTDTATIVDAIEALSGTNAQLVSNINLFLDTLTQILSSQEAT